MSTWWAANETLVQAALIATLLAYSFQVALRAGVPSFAGVGFWAIGGYASAQLVKDGWPTIPAIGAGLALAAVLGLLLGLLLDRLRSHFMAMATLAFVLLVQIMAQTLTSITGGAEGLYAIPLTLTTAWVGAIVAVVIGLLWIRERGASRRRLEVVRMDETLATSLGIDVRREHLKAFVLSAVLGALSGSLHPLLVTTLSPDDAGLQLAITTLLMIIVGGTGSWVGPILGAIVITWLPTWFGFLESWEPIVTAVVVLLMLVYVRGGLVGLASRVVLRVRGAFA